MAADTPTSRQCELRQLFLRDLSFEAPHVPGILFGHEQPAIELSVETTWKLSVESTKSLGDVYEVTVDITVKANAGDRPMFLIDLQQGGLFEVHGYEGEDLNFLLRTRAPEMLYPYARELISTLVGRAGFPRLYLRALNFEKVYADGLAAA
ncbi:MAG: protein-export chaperone SecB [Gammaproteobacteria bacterium]